MLHGSHCFSSLNEEERELELGVGVLFVCKGVFALTILMILRARTAAFFFLGELLTCVC